MDAHQAEKPLEKRLQSQDLFLVDTGPNIKRSADTLLTQKTKQARSTFPKPSASRKIAHSNAPRDSRYPLVVANEAQCLSTDLYKATVSKPSSS